MLQKIVIVGLLCLMSWGCNTTEETKKIDLEPIKENREGLDYSSKAQESLFIRLDQLLVQWHAAQKKDNRPAMQALGNELETLARNHFSELVQALEGPNAAIAAGSLGFSYDIRAIPYLNQALSKGDENTRHNAALALAHIGSDQTPMDPLFAVLDHDPANSVRAMAALAISEIVQKDKDFGSLPHLLKSLKDQFFMVRYHAIVALMRIGDAEGFQAIASTTMEDEHVAVRYNSILALHASKDKIFLPLVIQRLQDQVVEVRNIAYKVLKAWSGQTFPQDDIAAWRKWAGIE